MKPDIKSGNVTVTATCRCGNHNDNYPKKRFCTTCCRNFGRYLGGYQGPHLRPKNTFSAFNKEQKPTHY